MISIDGYSIRRCDRNRKGGGVALYIKDTIRDKCSIGKDLSESSLETLCLEIKSVRAAPFLIFTCYRPSNACEDTFRQLEQSMQILDRENKEIFLLGDANCGILPNYLDCDSFSNNPLIHVMRILEFYNLFGFQQLIETGNRETLLSSTLLDHILS